MLKIIRNNLKHTWFYILLIIAFLIVQAMADLNLPDFTSKIVNVGIQQKGVESALPEVVSKTTFEKILALSKKDKLIQDNYTYYSKNNFLEKDYYKVLKKYKNADNIECYVLNSKISDEDKEKLTSEMKKRLMLISVLENEEMLKQIGSSEFMQIPENTNVYQVFETLPEEQFNQIMGAVDERISETSESIVEQSAIIFVQNEYKELGVNIDKLQTNYIISAGGRMLGVALISMVAAIIITFLSAKIAATIGKLLREKVYKKVLSFSSTEYRKFGSSSLITRNTNDVQQIQNLFPMLFRVVVYAPIMGIGAFIKLLSNSQNSMAWIIGVGILAIIVVILSLFIIAMPKFKKLQDLIDKLNAVSREFLSGIPVIRAFNKEKYEENKFDIANLDLTKTNIFVNRAMSFMMPVLMLIMNGINILIIWEGAKGVDKGIMQVGNVMTFMQYAMHIVISFLFISLLSILLPRASVSAKRINDVLETDVLIKDSDNLKKFDQSKKGLVEFRNVSFKYEDSDSEVITDIDFVAKPGEVTAIIGGTGSGKSTVVNLIPRFYDVTAGEIVIDGVNIKEVSQKDLRDVIGFVPQKGVLFSGTIESNIKYSNEDMDDEAMIKAAQIAQAEEFINSKKDKYKSEIAQGGNNVSGGQKQRLSIARAIAKDPEIFVFDDSFSALDFKTDLNLRTELEKVTKDKTVIIVAQRINTIMNAEQIIVLDEGKIVGKGTHKQLMETCEVYKQIALSQLSEEELGA
jgi:ATP-binding cassette subfamily B protein